MFFKTPFAYAVVAAISASLIAFLGGLLVMGIYGGLVRFAVIPAVPHFNLLGLVVFVVGVFALSLPIETVYARRRLFSKDRHHGAKSGFLLFPVMVAVFICRFLWLKREPRR